MEDYSMGQKKKVLIAGSLSKKAHLFIWDEPLNYIDIESRIQIEELILEYKPTIYISISVFNSKLHIRYFLS